MKRYKELLYGDTTYTETYKINEILVKNGFEWFLDCEVENVRLEITKNTLIFNSGVFFNGNWEYGVFRDGQWKYGTWNGGVWYNGTWYNGIYKNGLIFGGKFINGKIEGGEIRGGDFFDIQISGEVAINIEQPTKNSPKPQQGHPVNRGQEQKVQLEQPVTQNIQLPKVEEKILRFKDFEMLNEGFFSSLKNLFKETPGADDDLGEKLLNHINTHDIQLTRKKKGGGIYYDYIKYTFPIHTGEINELDPFNEDDNSDDLNIKVISETDNQHYDINVYINDDKLDLIFNLKVRIKKALEKKYESKKEETKRNRFNRYKDII